MGKVLLRYNSLDSTNLEAQKLLSKQKRPIEGTTIVTDVQTDGKGQRGNTWLSPDGQNLLTSFIIYPTHLLPKHQFLLNIVASLALLDLLQNIEIENLSIKWPNDIYIGDRKVAGILIQNNVSHQQIASSIIGIGLNVNQKKFDNGLPNPTSLAIETCKAHQLESLLDALAYFLEKRYLQSKTANGIKELRRLYTHSLFRLESIGTYLIDNSHYAGIIKGIDPNGKLILQMEQHTRVFDFQELKFVI